MPLDKQTEYAVEDADITFQLKQFFDQELAAENGKLFQEVELPLVEVLTAMEQEDQSQHPFKEFEIALDSDIARLEKSIFEQAGEEFNLARQNNLAHLIWKIKIGR